MVAMEWVLLGVSAVLVLACGFFGAAEYSFVAVDRSSVERAANAGDRGAVGVRSALRTLSTQLSGAQVGTTAGCSAAVSRARLPVSSSTP
jgi:CBS domain containing-hemolysin-like protein